VEYGIAWGGTWGVFIPFDFLGLILGGIWSIVALSTVPVGNFALSARVVHVGNLQRGGMMNFLRNATAIVVAVRASGKRGGVGFDCFGGICRQQWLLLFRFAWMQGRLLPWV